MKKLKNYQPKNTPRWHVSNIIGEDKFMELEANGFRVVARDKLMQKQHKLVEYKKTILSLSTLISQLGRQHQVGHPNFQSQ